MEESIHYEWNKIEERKVAQIKKKDKLEKVIDKNKKIM